MKKLLTIIGIILALGILIFIKFFLLRGTSVKNLLKPSSKSYRTYVQCVNESHLPCTFQYVGDFGQEWRPSTYMTKEECMKETAINGVSCVIPEGQYNQQRWISENDVWSAQREEPQNAPGNFPYSKDKTYSYSNPNINTSATFQGYEKCPTVSGEGICPKFITNDGKNSGTVWWNGLINMKVKSSNTATQVEALNKKYNVVHMSYQPAVSMYTIEIGLNQNIFDVVNAYMQTGIFEFVEPSWIIQGQNASS